MQNNSLAVLLNIPTTSRLLGNVRCFDQNYQPGKITLQVSFLIIIAMSMCCVFWFELLFR